MSVTAGDKGTHQNVARVDLILSILAQSSQLGLRLKDVVDTTGLSKTVAHRFLAGMVQYGLVDYDDVLGRYFLGLKMAVWASESNKRYGLGHIAGSALATLAEKTQDTVYLMLRHNTACRCIERREGSYPIKTLTMAVGDRRPLGAGAGPLAILSYLPDPDVELSLRAHEAEISDFGFSSAEIWKMVGETRKRGFATIDNRITPGMSGVAVPIKRRDGEAFAAINVVAVSDRMRSDRRDQIAEMIKEEVAKLETQLGNLLSVDGVDVITKHSAAG